jgi:hypothetical protein
VAPGQASGLQARSLAVGRIPGPAALNETRFLAGGNSRSRLSRNYSFGLGTFDAKTQCGGAATNEAGNPIQRKGR